MKLDRKEEIAETECQVFIAIGGSNKDAVRVELQKLIDDIDRCGKPIQGTNIGATVREVITPKWNGLDY